jgi:hypothetical protein
VADAEVRAPALFFLDPDRPYGPVPLEAALFFDAGAAWTSENPPLFLGGGRRLFRSWGAALRFNLLGAALGEIAYVRPLDLPGRSSLWRLRLAPAF